MQIILGTKIPRAKCPVTNSPCHEKSSRAKYVSLIVHNVIFAQSMYPCVIFQLLIINSLTKPINENDKYILLKIQISEILTHSFDQYMLTNIYKYTCHNQYIKVRISNSECKKNYGRILLIGSLWSQGWPD